MVIDIKYSCIKTPPLIILEHHSVVFIDHITL